MNLAGRGSVFLVSLTRLVESLLLSMSMSCPLTNKIALFPLGGKQNDAVLALPSQLSRESIKSRWAAVSILRRVAVSSGRVSAQ